ncbi:TetR/AcrR family transcriptional regulator [Staphylococcus shinii]|uniref:TetR/AcrR family transcriptional regulator n=1 Tax=Staphylococcus shinii TaxID=2912228 RepID=UPI003CFB37E4
MTKLTRKQEQLICSANQLFDKQGFSATGIDQIIQASNVATMTLYRNYKSKDDLIVAVLKYREDVYMNFLESNNNKTLEHMIEQHLEWLKSKNTNGCLFLKAMEEFRHSNQEIVDIVSNHKIKVAKLIEEKLESENYHNIKDLAKELLFILEGSTSMIEHMDFADVKSITISLSKGVLNNE